MKKEECAGSYEVVAFVLGVLSIVFALLNGIMGLTIGIVGLFFSISQYRRTKSAFAKKALTLNVIGIGVSVVVLVLGFVLASYVKSHPEILAQFQQATP